VTVPQRSALSGPTLIRLLARLTDSNVAEPAQTLSQRLSGWLDWTDAIALSSALGGGASAAIVADALPFGTTEACESECHRVRAMLARAIARDSTLMPASPATRRTPGRASIPAHAPQRNDKGDDAADYTLFRQCYLSLQQSMESHIGNLRRRLRATLAMRSSAMGRLAMVDAAMERALEAREQHLLSSAPVALRGHFERLRTAEADRLAREQEQQQEQHQRQAQAQAQGGLPTIEPGAWLDAFRYDMQCVLHAELDLRFQPVQGVLAALRTC
jgi:Protein of unknown function (DUF3348)